MNGGHAGGLHGRINVCVVKRPDCFSKLLGWKFAMGLYPPCVKILEKYSEICERMKKKQYVQKN